MKLPKQTNHALKRIAMPSIDRTKGMKEVSNVKQEVMVWPAGNVRVKFWKVFQVCSNMLLISFNVFNGDCLAISKFKCLN